MKQRTRLDPDQRREQILRVATAAFREAGYAGVSLEAVADAAGVTRGLVHHYFGSKRDLFVEVVRQAVQFPAEVRIVPRDLSGDFPSIIRACVHMWMAMIEEAGGLWSGIAGTGGIAGPDIDWVLDDARDGLVERMLAEVPFPDTLDPDLLRSALHCYAAFARVVGDEWLERRTLARQQAAALLELTLISLVDVVVPGMEGPPAPT